MITVANDCLIIPNPKEEAMKPIVILFSAAKKKSITFPCGHMTWHPFKLLIAESILIVQKLMYHNLSFDPHNRLLISSKSSENGIPFKSFFYTVSEIATSSPAIKRFCVTDAETDDYSIQL